MTVRNSQCAIRVARNRIVIGIAGIFDSVYAGTTVDCVIARRGFDDIVAGERLDVVVKLRAFQVVGLGCAENGVFDGQRLSDCDAGLRRVSLNGKIKAQFPKCMHGLLIAAARQARGDALPTMPMRWNHRR